MPRSLTPAHLLAAAALAAALLVIGALAVAILLSGDESPPRVACPAVATPTSRDPDAQQIVDLVDEAAAAARGTRVGLQLYGVSMFPWPSSGPMFAFVAKDQPVVLVGFSGGEPHAGTGVKFRGSVGEPLRLDDLTLGPGRAIAAVEAQYPAVRTLGLGVTRGDDCDLVWRVAGLIDSDSRDPLELRADVHNSTGAVSLPEGPPRSLNPRSR